MSHSQRSQASQEPLEEGLPGDLVRPDAHPEDARAAEGVRHVQTHISHVFLTPARVVKLRKAVRPGFLDFGTRAARNADAARELELNRRLAPDVYLGLAPLRRGPAGRWQVGPLREGVARVEPVPEHAVVMRRLPEGRDACSLLARDLLEPSHLEAVARVLARFHARAGLGRPAPWTPAPWLERTAAPMRANFAALEGRLDERRRREVAHACEARLAALAPALERRRLEGRAVDGHGDLHLEHVWLEEADGRVEPRLIDCIEFDAELRRIDVASEVAFLDMDLVYRQREDLAAHFLRSYASATDDFGLFEVVDLYASYRAAVRAKVASLTAGEQEKGSPRRREAVASAERHLELAGRLLEPVGPGPLVLVCGTVGVGKTHVAHRLAEALHGVVVASDPTRKRMAGLAPTAPAAAASDAGLYTPERSEAVYRGLLARAEPIVRSGRPVLLDATWGRRRHREAARACAERLGAPLVAVEVDCPEALARSRVAARRAAGGDPSDAGPERVAPSRAHFEPLDELPPAQRFRVRTDQSDLHAALAPVRRALAGGAADGSPTGRRSLQSRC